MSITIRYSHHRDEIIIYVFCFLHLSINPTLGSCYFERTHMGIGTEIVLNPMTATGISETAFWWSRNPNGHKLRCMYIIFRGETTFKKIPKKVIKQQLNKCTVDNPLWCLRVTLKFKEMFNFSLNAKALSCHIIVIVIIRRYNSRLLL